MMFQVFLPGLGDVGLRPNHTEQISIEGSSCGAILQSPVAAAFVGAFFGCLATLYLSAIGIAPGIASALATTLLCGEVLLIQRPNLLPGELFTAIYGGAFGGMTPVLWLNGNIGDPSLVQIVVLFVSLSVLCGLAFSIVALIDTCSERPLAFGCGGRSGAIATVACFLFLALAPLFGGDDRLFRAAGADALDANLASAVLLGLACLIGTLATLFALRRQSFESATTADRTFVASTVALIGLILLYLNDLGGARTSDAFYAGCFLGMSTPDRLKGQISPVLGSIVLAVLLVQVRMLLPGIGGSLGLAAFVTVVALVAMGRMTTFVTTAVLHHRKETAIRWPAIGSVSQFWMRAEVSAWFGPQGSFAISMLRRPAYAMTNAILASAAIGCIIMLPGKLAPEKLVVDTARSTELSHVSEAVSSQLDLMQAKAAVDDAFENGPPSVDVDNDKLRTTQEPWRAEEPVDRQEEDVHPPVDTTRTTAQVATPEVAEPAPGGATTDVPESKEKIFLEFEQWRAARLTGIAGSVAAPPKVRPREKRHDRAISHSGTEPVGSSPGQVHARGSASPGRGNQLPK